VKEQGKFGVAEAVVLLTVSNMARIFLTFPSYLVDAAGPAAWLSSLAGLALALLQVWLFYLILKPHPRENIMDITTGALGRFAGPAVNVIFAAFFIIVGAMFMRIVSEALLVSALPYTPISVVSTGYIATAVLGAYLGLEALARSVRVTYPFVVGGIAFLLLSLAPTWDASMLFPLLGTGPAGVFLKGGLLSGAVAEILLAAVIVRSFHGPEMFRRVTARAMLMGFAYLTLLELVLIMTIGWNTARESTLPFYLLSRSISLGRFFQRVESIFIIIWGFIGMVKLALSLYAAAAILTRTLKLPDYRPLIWPLALVTFVAGLLPPDLPTAVKIESLYLRQFIWLPTLALPAVVLAADRLRMRGGQNEGG
jgi:spore germination protein (amino acid permease)